jgi:hypothetical protein
MLCMEERNAYSFGREPERYRPLRRPRRLWEDTIRINLKETERDAMDWTRLPQVR